MPQPIVSAIVMKSVRLAPMLIPSTIYARQPVHGQPLISISSIRQQVTESVSWCALPLTGLATPTPRLVFRLVHLGSTETTTPPLEDVRVSVLEAGLDWSLAPGYALKNVQLAHGPPL